jgi:hypothetical protein
MKPIDQVTLEDLEGLISTLRFKENEGIEYKSTLPTESGEDDSWIQGETRIGKYAVKKLTAEIIAFANTLGGVLIIGIQENSETPSRPESIKPLPRCHELDLKLMQAIIDSIEPRLTSFQSHVIDTDTQGNGVILVHVKRSDNAPHRSTKDNQCYMRIQDRCLKMNMVEIQKMTLKHSKQKIEGLWSAKFGISGQYQNAGVAVLINGKIYGGDTNYLYSGIYEIQNEEDIVSNILIEHYHGEAYTAFNTREKQFSVSLIGKFKENIVRGALYKHSSPQGEIQILLERRRELI